MNIRIFPAKPRRVPLKILLTALYGGAVLLFSRLGVPCVYRHFLGIQCPGCGMTRAWTAILHLDFAAAFGYNFMFWSVPVLYLYILFDGTVVRPEWLNRAVLTAVFSGFFIQFILRLAESL